jgi:hypothetical protein
VASSSTALTASIIPISNEPTPIFGQADTPKRQIAPPNTTPTRPPGRSLYRPGPRNPPTVLE